MKKHYDGQIFLRAVKAMVKATASVTLSDSFRSLARLSNFTHLRNLYEKSLEGSMAGSRARGYGCKLVSGSMGSLLIHRFQASPAFLCLPRAAADMLAMLLLSFGLASIAGEGPVVRNVAQQVTARSVSMKGQQSTRGNNINVVLHMVLQPTTAVPARLSTAASFSVGCRRFGEDDNVNIPAQRTGGCHEALARLGAAHVRWR